MKSMHEIARLQTWIYKKISLPWEGDTPSHTRWLSSLGLGRFAPSHCAPLYKIPGSAPVTMLRWRRRRYRHRLSSASILIITSLLDHPGHHRSRFTRRQIVVHVDISPIIKDMNWSRRLFRRKSLMSYLCNFDLTMSVYFLAIVNGSMLLAIINDE